MTEHIFVVSEWLPKVKKDAELWKHAQEIMVLTGKEKGCLRAHAMRQLLHPNAPGKSQYTIVLLQEYVNVEAFDIHCQADYVTRFFKKYVENPETSIVAEYTVRLFRDG